MSGNDFLELIEQADKPVEEWYAEDSGMYLNPVDGQVEWDSLEPSQQDDVIDSYGQWLAEGK